MLAFEDYVSPNIALLQFVAKLSFRVIISGVFFKLFQDCHTQKYIFFHLNSKFRIPTKRTVSMLAIRLSAFPTITRMLSVTKLGNAVKITEVKLS